MDWSRIDNLVDEVGSDAFAEVLNLFIEESDEIVTQIEAAPGTPELMDQLHVLKGAALNLGFNQLAALCYEAEKQLQLGYQIRPAVLISCYASCKEALFSGLEGPRKVA